MEMEMAINWRMELRNQRIVELWSQDKTSTEIAKMLGMTRSAVMGVVNRHGERKGPKKIIEAKPPKTKVIEVADLKNPLKSVRKRVKIKPVRQIEEISYARTKGKKIIDLGPFDCRWIFEDSSYCAKPKTFRSYCEHHARIVYVPNVKKERPRQSEL
jgi:hypothetical protein